MMPFSWMRAISVAALSVCLTYPAYSAPATDVVKTNLQPLIETAAQEPARFAVDVAHEVSLEGNGEWTTQGDAATWRYSVRVPSAISLSFHATRIALPGGATLTVRAGGETYIYRQSDIRGVTFYSRISRGETLDMELATATKDRASVVLDIDSLQVGFRKPTAWRIQALPGTANSACVQNYACNITSGNAGSGKASVAVFVQNVGACSGTLINNATGDNTPYVLTARHCQNKKISGDEAYAPEDISVYWNALTPCGQPLGSLYASSQIIQYGLTTVVEQEDLWLLLLDQPPKVSDAWFAGFDATGASVQGGYTIHHGVSSNKQFAEWFGQALSTTGVYPVLGGGYTSHFWETVNVRGNVGPGASGSALFDENNRVVGALSLASSTTDASGWDECPATPLAAPGTRHSVGYFSQLAAAWDSTADTTSRTGSKTLRSVLDPHDTGTVILDGTPLEPGLTFTASRHSQDVRNPVFLNWSAPGAVSCTASDGVSGDGWAGPRAVSGTFEARSTIAGVVSYPIVCSMSDGRSVKALVVVTWTLPPPILDFSVNWFEVWARSPITVRWSSTVAPCSLRGGSIALDNLDATGTTTLTEAVPTGPTRYAITCGTGKRTTSGSVYLTFTAPTLTFSVNATDRRPGQHILLNWKSGAQSCAATGGAPADGWENPARGREASHFVFLSTPGTYTYSLECKSGDVVARADTTVTVRDVPAYATLTVPNTTVVAGQPVEVNWKSNVSGCTATYDTYTGIPVSRGSAEEGGGFATFPSAGTHEVRYRCAGSGADVESGPVTLTVVDRPTVNLGLDVVSIEKGKTFKLTWKGQATASCSASGGGADGATWGGDVGTSGERTLTASNVGTFTYAIACASTVAGASPATNSAAITVTDSSAPRPNSPSSTGSSGGGGGGGALNGFSVFGLALLALLRAWTFIRRRACSPFPPTSAAAGASPDPLRSSDAAGAPTA